MVGKNGRSADITGRSFERILLIKPSSLGDIIHALPVLHGLRGRYPEARIDWLVSTPFLSLLEGHPDLTELVPFDRRRFGRVATSPRATGSFLKFIGNLRARSYDLVVDLQGLFRSGFLSAVTGAPVRVGFRAAREGAWVFYTHRCVVVDPDMHAVDRYYLVADLLDFASVPIGFNLALGEQVKQEAADLLGDAGYTGAGRLVAVAPGARWETKAWLPECFARTIEQVQAAPGLRCVLLGGPEEIELCRRIADSCSSPPLNLTGQTSLKQLAALLDRSACVLCHDSGVAHVAAALGRPLVCIVGPTNPDRTGPYGRRDSVLGMTLDCAPCYFRRLSQCSHDHRCMRELPVRDVVSAVQAALDQEQLSPS